MILTVHNCNIYYEIHGEGIPILMVHGWGPDHRLMKGCMEPVFQVIDSKWKRIYFDLPGMGKSKGDPWIKGFDQMLEVVLEFINAVIPNQHFLVAGESYGGKLARGIINKCSTIVDGLLLICPAAGGEGAKFQVLENDNALLESLSESDRKYLEMEGINAVRNRRVWDRFNEEVLSGLKIADNSFLGNCQEPSSLQVDMLEAPYMKPTLMLAGRQDSVVGYRGLWELIDMYPRASFVLLDKAGHDLQIEQNVLFSETVKEWLNRVLMDMTLSGESKS